MTISQLINDISHNDHKDQTKEPSTSEMLYYASSKGVHPNYIHILEDKRFILDPKSIITFFMSLPFITTSINMGFFF